MTIDVTCPCGKRIRVGAQHAGRMASCKACGHRFRIPRSDASPVEAPQPIELLFDPAPAPTPLDAPPGFVPPAVIVETDQDLNYAPGEVVRPTESVPPRGYWMDLLFSFAYPFWTVSNIVTFLVIAVLDGMVLIANFSPFGLFASFFLWGWLAALFFNVIQESAAGSEDLPGIKMEGGFFDDILRPAFKFAMAVVVAELGVVVCFLFTFSLAPVSWTIYVVAGLLGMFLMPMVLLMFSFGSFSSLVRLDLIGITIGRTLVPYVVTWLMLLAASYLWYGIYILQAFAFRGIGGALAALTIQGLWVQFGARILRNYLAIVAMRQIGIYYLHFKRRFAIDME